MFRFLPTLIIVSLLLSSYLQAQNLGPNSSFEDIRCLKECSSGIINNRLIADHWWSATQASPDIFSPCNIIYYDPLDSSIICDFWGVPKNWLGSSYAHSGQNYAGYWAGLIFFKDSIIPDNWKEFPEVSLKKPLKAGKKYCTGLYIKQAFHYNTSTTLKGTSREKYSEPLVIIRAGDGT